MSYAIQINTTSSTPKYKQIANCIIHGIENQMIGMEEQLPSINELSSLYNISRDTAEKAYRLLKKEGIIKSVRGKGYFTSITKIKKERKILLIFNKLSVYKEMMYEGFVRTLGENAWIDLQIYYEDFRLFERIVHKKAGLFTDYIIIPSFLGEEELRAKDLINKYLGKQQLILLNSYLEGINNLRGAVVQNYEKDIKKALSQIKHRLFKYERLHLVFPFSCRYSRGIVRGFKQFCQHYNIESKIIFKNFDKEPLKKGTAFIIIKDDDLVTLVQKMKMQHLKCTEDVGILAYNDSPLKQVLLNGITVMTTDHRKMGELAARMVLNHNLEKVENQFEIIERDSL